MLIAAGCANLANNRQYHVFGGDTHANRAIHSDTHILHLLGHQTLSGQYMLNLRGADTVSQTGERTVSRCMGITADHGHAWHSGAQLRPHNMDNALPHLIDFKFLNTIEIAVII